MAQGVEHLPTKFKALSSNSGTKKEREDKPSQIAYMRMCIRHSKKVEVSGKIKSNQDWGIIALINCHQAAMDISLKSFKSPIKRIINNFFHIGQAFKSFFIFMKYKYGLFA
jgi:hypothetical protein